MELKKKNRNIW